MDNDTFLRRADAPAGQIGMCAMVLRPEQLAGTELRGAYRRDGVVCLRNAFAEEWVDLLREGVRRNLAHPTTNFMDLSPPGAPGGFVTDMWAWRQISEYEKFVRDSPVGELVGTITDAREVSFVEDNVFVKRPGVQAPTPWHQDKPYYEIEGTMCSVWVPLDRYSKADCLEFIRGSHRWGKLFLPVDFAPSRDGERLIENTPPPPFELMPDIDSSRASFDILSWPLEVGDAIIFDALTVHGNAGNRASPGGRRISFRFASEDAVYVPNRHPWAQLNVEHGLAPGQRLACGAFPAIWNAAAD